MDSDSGNKQAYLGLSDLIAWVRSYWLQILVPMLVGGLLGVAYASLATPQYRVETLLAPRESSPPGMGLGQLGTQLGALGLGSMFSQPGSNQADVSVAILRSRKFLGDFIVKHDLLPKLFAGRWDEGRSAWKDDGGPPPSTNDAYRKIRQNHLLVTRDELTGLVTVAFEWKDPDEAHAWLVAIIDDLNEGVRQRERENAARSLQFLREELQRTDVVVIQQALHQLSLNELQKLTLANVRDDFAFQVIDPPSLPDEDDPVWPKPLLMVLGGLFLGLFVGLAAAALRTAWQASAPRG